MWGKINALCTPQSTDVPTRPPGLLCPPQVSTLYAQPSVAAHLQRLARQLCLFVWTETALKP